MRRVRCVTGSVSDGEAGRERKTVSTARQTRNGSPSLSLGGGVLVVVVVVFLGGL